MSARGWGGIHLAALEGKGGREEEYAEWEGPMGCARECLGVVGSGMAEAWSVGCLNSQCS